MAHVQDITARKSADQALRESEMRFRQLAENIHEVFWLSDVEKNAMMYISPGYEKIWGRTCQSLYDSPRDWLEAIHPEDRARVMQAAQEKQVRGEYDELYRIVRPDGSVRWIRDRAFPIRDESGQIYRVTGIAEDVTARRQLEEAITEIRDRERRRLAQDLHDSLGQQLTGISLLCKALEGKLAGKSRAHVQAVRAISKLVTGAIADTKDLAHNLYPLKLRENGLAPALREMAVETSRLFGVPCIFACPAPVVCRDHDAATHLYRIAQEALSNAMHHGKPRQVRVDLCQDNQVIWLIVRDDGKGFSPAKAARKKGKGLKIMEHRAAVMGGKLEVSSKPRHGTSVTCWVPVTG